MPTQVTGWISDVSRGPDWLYVRLHSGDETPSHAHLAECTCQLLEQHFLTRLVIELDEIDSLQSDLLGELVRMHKRVCSRGGIMRLSGVSDANQQVLEQSRLANRFPVFRCRHDAVMGCSSEPHTALAEKPSIK